MSYTIRPNEVLAVVAATGRDHATLHESLVRASGFVAAAAEGDQGAPAVVAELAALRAEHDRLTALQQTRVQQADGGVRAAISCYRDGDAQMAAAFARSGAVLMGAPEVPPGSGSRSRFRVHHVGPLPDVLRGS